MIHRREVLKAGAGLALAAPLRIPLKLLTAAAGAPAADAPDVMAETGLAAATALISAARHNARHARVVDLDSTVMIRRLSEAWARGPRPLFGMTRSDVAILVEALARDYGMAVVYRGWHDHRADGTIHHVLYGDRNSIAILEREFATSGAGFGKVLGEQVGALAALSPRCESRNFTAAFGGSMPARARFVTWAVAPAGSTTVA
jgi:hypothetical protein